MTSRTCHHPGAADGKWIQDRAAQLPNLLNCPLCLLECAPPGGLDALSPLLCKPTVYSSSINKHQMNATCKRMAEVYLLQIDDIISFLLALHLNCELEVCIKVVKQSLQPPISLQ